MKITPLDIDQQQFQRVFRGVDQDEVRSFLSQVSRQLEDVVRDNQRLDEQVRRQEKQLEEFRSHDGQLREALASAGRMTEDIRESAKKEAELIRAEASVEAEKVVADARAELARLSEETRSLKLQKTRLISELKTVIESHRRLLEAQEELDRQAISQRKNGQVRARR
jgi:cell division initiation protein